MADAQLQARDGDTLRCCCGSSECAFLRHNSSVLDSVERDVHTAASMGKALLERHEAYMADAERDRVELTSRIEDLAMENKELEARNATAIEENRSLLNQLETLNTTVTDSDSHIRSLEATLLSSQQIIRRLEGETARAQSLERQIALLEQEQEQLQSTLASTHEEARSSISRWQRAERGIINLQEQLERMESEAREEREKHAEVMDRMEKQREVEKELNTAAGRLKGAAASQSLHSGKNGSNVVSHFVRDLLQDNTNLQQGMIELREMLMNSNDEIQALREQLMYHQPLEDGDASATPTLRTELEVKEPPEPRAPVVSQELHIHHHYHVTPKAESKKPRKKRHVITPGAFTPPAQPSLSSTPPPLTWRTPAPNRTPRDSLMSNRVSILSEQASEFALSSVPSSPQSNPRNSLFDPVGLDSWPASPTTSIDPMSPTWRGHSKHASNISSRSFQTPTPFSLDQVPPARTHTIVEEPVSLEGVPDLGIHTEDLVRDDETTFKSHGASSHEVEIYLDDTDSDGPPRRQLRRALSHESIISLSGGLDIHTLKIRPSQLTLRPLSSATSITASSTVTARPMLSHTTAKRSSAMLRETYTSTPTASLRAVSGPLSQGSSSGSSKLSSWVGWRPWGGASPNARNPAKDGEKQYYKDYGRPPGINQAGAIPGFHEYLEAHRKRTPGKVMPDEVDREALREGLDE